MRSGLNLLLANALAIICIFMVYLLVDRGHTGFAVACMVLAYLTANCPEDVDKGEKNAGSEKRSDHGNGKGSAG